MRIEQSLKKNFDKWWNSRARTLFYLPSGNKQTGKKRVDRPIVDGDRVSPEEKQQCNFTNGRAEEGCEHTPMRATVEKNSQPLPLQFPVGNEDVSTGNQ